MFAIGRGVSINTFLLIFVPAFPSDLFIRETLDDIDLEHKVENEICEAQDLLNFPASLPSDSSWVGLLCPQCNHFI